MFAIFQVEAAGILRVIPAVLNDLAFARYAHVGQRENVPVRLFA
jgi:hypothetical protein